MVRLLFLAITQSVVAMGTYRWFLTVPLGGSLLPYGQDDALAIQC